VDLSGGLGDSRRAESGVSWTRFATHPTLRIGICQIAGFGSLYLELGTWYLVLGTWYLELCT
jgi:hypothetical protein